MKPLRNASTLILVAKNKLIKNPKIKANDINVFALRRSLTASHFPDSYVFPGGNCDPADEIPDWMELFPKSELNVPLSLSNNEFDSTNSNAIPTAISSRITAIRETFEESGILLCKKKTDAESFFATNYKIQNEIDWRKKISKNPIEFFNFCRKYECFPNLSCLHFLSNWITPHIFPKRFDGKFFIAALDHEVEGEPDETEIQEVKWESVNYFLKNESIFLPPPQVYELNRLNSFENFQSLCNFIKNLDQLTCHPYIPVSLNATDGYILILPGDELYEKYSAFPSDHTIDVDCDIASFRGNVMNRVEYKDVDKKNFRATRGEVVTKNVKFHEDSSCSINRSKM